MLSSVVQLIPSIPRNLSRSPVDHTIVVQDCWPGHLTARLGDHALARLRWVSSYWPNSPGKRQAVSRGLTDDVPSTGLKKNIEYFIWHRLSEV